MQKSEKNSEKFPGLFIPLWLKLSALISAILLSTFMVTTLLYYIGSEAVLKKSFNEKMVNAALQLRIATGIQLRSTVQILNALALSYHHANDLENSLISQQKLNPLLKQVFVLDINGKLTHQLPFNPKMIGTIHKKKVFFTIPYYEKRLYIGYFVTSFWSKSPHLIITVPLEMSAKDKLAPPIKGVLGAVIPISDFLKPLKQYVISENSVIFLLSEKNVLFSSQIDYPSLMTTKYLNSLKEKKWNAPVLVDNYISEVGDKHFIAICREDFTQWFIGIDAPFYDFIKHFKAIYQYIFIGEIFSLFIAFVVFIFFIRRFNISIRDLSNSIEKGVNGEFDAILKVSHHDELGLMAFNVNKLLTTLKKRKENLADAYRRITSQEVMKRDVSIAQQIQIAMIPSHFPQLDNVDLAGIYEPAREVGGDVLDSFENDDGTISLLVADVSGKGIPAALVMAQTKIIFRIIATKEDTILHIMNKANSILYQNLSKTSFVTAFFAKYNPEKMILRYCNAGHNPPFYYSRVQNRVMELKEEESCCLGAWETFEGKERSIKFNSGDALLIFTDGATEATNEEGNMFEEIRLIKAFEKYHHLSALSAIENIKKDIASFVGNAVVYDDLTMILLKVGKK